MAAAFRWSVRIFALLAMLLFAALTVIFVLVTVDQFGQKQYVTDAVAGLPPVYVITALLVPCCAAFVAGFWMLFLDSFKREAAADQVVTAMPHPMLREPARRERLARWARARKPHWPGRAQH